MKRASENQFDELHNRVTKEFLARVKSGDCTTADLKAACDWLKANDITGVAVTNSPLANLANLVPVVDPELVRSRINVRTYD